MEINREEQILQDEPMQAITEPPEVYHMDCFPVAMGGCGGKGTLAYTVCRYNGHKRGRCEKCGLSFIE